MITVPATFEADVVHREGEVGRHWLADLPAQVASCCADWGLSIDGEPMHGNLSLIVPVRRGDERAVLKRVWAEDDATAEACALAAWDGRGVTGEARSIGATRQKGGVTHTPARLRE